MNSKPGPEIRNDDVLQTFMSVTKHQRSDLRGRTLFECFWHSDKMFEKYQYPCTLAVLAEGIDYNSEWVEHIKKYKHRFKIELHGNNHINYSHYGDDKIREELGKGIDKIEKTFGTRPEIWYPPWGRRGAPENGVRICLELGIKMYEQVGKVDAKLWLKNPDKYPHINFHYWNDKQVDQVEQILNRLHESSF